MKSRIILILLVSVLIPFSSKATGMQGACSSHGGVNTSIGDFDGSVICNDGWTDSSVPYIPQSPIRPITCATQADVTALESEMISSGSSQYTNSSDGLIEACQSSVNQYQAALSNYQVQLNLYNQTSQTRYQQVDPKHSTDADLQAAENQTRELLKTNCDLRNGIFSDSTLSCDTPVITSEPIVVNSVPVLITPTLPISKATKVQTKTIVKLAPVIAITTPIEKVQATQSLPKEISKPNLFHNIRNFFRKVFK